MVKGERNFTDLKVTPTCLVSQVQGRESWNTKRIRQRLLSIQRTLPFQ
jgi:hypothetical protein